MRKRIEKDPEGLNPLILEVMTQADEHETHKTETEPSETLHDNSVEHTLWGFCRTCDKEFVIHSVTIVGGL